MDDRSGPLTPHELLALDLSRLVGLPVGEAERLVEDAGGRLRAVPPGAAVTLGYRPDRVTVTVDGGRVIATGGIG
jgi:hypothetical protein